MNLIAKSRVPDFKQRRIYSLHSSCFKSRVKWLAISFLTIWILVIIALLIWYQFETKYYQKVYPGIRLGRFSLSGLTSAELLEIINKYQTNLETNGIIFRYKNKSVQFFPQVVATGDPDLTYELFFLDQRKIIDKIFKIGRDKGILQNLKTQINLLKTPIQVKADYQVFEENITQALRENFQDQEQRALDAQLMVDKSLDIVIIPEQEGIIPDYQSGIDQLEFNLSELWSKPIILSARRDYPKITASALLTKKQEIEHLFANKEKLILSFHKKNWSISKTEYKNWLDVKAEHLLFKTGLVDYIKENIANLIEVPMQEARFKITEEGRVVEFKPSRIGRSIDYEKTLQLINQSFFSDFLTNEPIEIVANIIEPQETTESVNDLGIKELLGQGRSNFAGSPKNRRHNIKVGAEALNGILIKPDEEFSLVAALGTIDEQAGYLPELVIKGNRTIPELGGGLCQIGTTLFRVALQSGLPITERRSHSYRVSYYEPAGTDCTIYPPHPDCRFLNDTGKYLLLQTHIDGDDLIFELWGTSDGRKVAITEPVIYKITKPLPTKYIETQDLEPGQTRCTERAHEGAETKFDYSVKYADGTEKIRTFYSYYKPWQAVCLIGPNH